MNLDYITCSDPRENTSIPDVLRFLRQYPRAELAVQAHPSKMSVGMPRRQWFDALLQMASTMRVPPNLAVHVNLEWCDALCLGEMPADIAQWMQARDSRSAPLVRRIQVNLSGSHSPKFHADAVAEMINHFPDHEFIFQYTPAQNSRLRRLADTGTRFSVLYDASGGTGRAPRQTGRPFAYAIRTGYSGGIGPENVTERLAKIAPRAGNLPIWIDAEGGLKNPNTGKFDLMRAQIYVDAAMKWLKENVR